jgi:hypothetical protein
LCFFKKHFDKTGVRKFFPKEEELWFGEARIFCSRRSGP